MARLHPAARAEDTLNAALAAVLARRHWKVQVLAYTGYGGGSFARIMGRVVLARHGQPDTAVTAPEAPVRRGFWVFFAAPLAHVEVQVGFGAATATARTDRGGYFDIELTDHGEAPGWHEASVTVKGVQTTTAVQIVSDEARFGIVSDIDDTCLVTSLPRPMIAAWNTFVLEETARKVVPGMAAMYRALLANQPGAPIVYLSTGAWNTQPTLARFMRRHGFPMGAMLLTDWGPTETSLFRSGQRHKRETLRRLAREFPHIRWLLVGDDGQHDPRIYDEFALEHPDHVDGIAIRQLTIAQQMLSHGHPLTKDEVSGREAQHHVFQGPDGYTLHRLVQGARTTTVERVGASALPDAPPVVEEP